MASRLFHAAILGAPASGKGTISARIVKRFNIAHVSSGDILRNHIRDETDIGKEAKQHIKEGHLVPDTLITKLVMEELSQQENESWLLDGFPRTRAQAEELCKKYTMHMAIKLVVPFDIIVDRVKGRMVHIPSGRVYNNDFKPPKIPGFDDVTGEPLEQRPDDRPEAVQRRLEIYEENVEPLIDYYREKQILYLFHGRTSNEIWSQVEPALVPYLDPQ